MLLDLDLLSERRVDRAMQVWAGGCSLPLRELLHSTFAAPNDASTSGLP
jgi:hypothetical protein